MSYTKGIRDSGIGDDFMTARDPIYHQLLPVLQSKIYEFTQFGYTTITVAALWDYCKQVLWQDEPLVEQHLHRLTADIFAVNATQIVDRQFEQEAVIADNEQLLTAEELALLLDEDDTVLMHEDYAIEDATKFLAEDEEL